MNSYLAKIKVLVVVVLLLCTYHSVEAQKKPKKKSRKEKKLERRTQLKQAIIDSNFVFITQKIVTPYVDNNWSGGYLNIEVAFVRVQELDWVNLSGAKIRLNERAKIQNYQVLSIQNSPDLIIQFNSTIRGRRYDFSMTFSEENKHELIIKSANETVRYSGKFK